MSLATDPLSADALKGMAISWLSERFPEAIIVTELSVADWGAASIDVAAITESHIAGVEIKGTGDSPARLDRQGLAYGMVAREMWLLPCPTIMAKCFAKRPPGWGRLEVWDDAVRPYNRATKMGEKVKTKLGWTYERLRDDSRYEPAVPTVRGHLSPHAMCGTLWRDELAAIAARTGVTGLVRGAYVHTLSEAIEDQVPVSLLHSEMIRELRARVWKKPILDLRAPEARAQCHGQLPI